MGDRNEKRMKGKKKRMLTSERIKRKAKNKDGRKKSKDRKKKEMKG